jgi:general secretion pathway protein B
MSYILDALKKLEHEKTKKARGNGMSSITGELFSTEQQRSDGRGAGKAVLITVCAVLVTFGTTWYFLKPAKQSHKAASTAPVPAPTVATSPPMQPPAVSAHVQQPQAETVSQAAAPVVNPAPQPPQKATPRTPTSVAAPTVSVPKQKAVAVKQTVPTHNAEEAAALITVQELNKRMKGQKGATAPTIAPPADIKLSGIAWQDDHRARRAVINGFLMQEGGTISGARITEIQQDRVRFSQSGSVFEISLASSSGITPSR